MTTDEIDLVGQILGPGTGASAWQSDSPASDGLESTSLVGASVSATPSVAPALVWSESDSLIGDSAPVATKHRLRLRDPLARARSDAPRRFRAVWFVVGFALGALASLLICTAVALSLSSNYSNRVLPGVEVGSVDVSGLSRDQVIAKLQTAYAYLGQGQVTVTTPVRTDVITYQELGRGPDLEVMADAAMSTGHTDNPIGDAVSIIRDAISGQSIPVVVQIDPMALAQRMHKLVGTTAATPRNAQAMDWKGTFAVSPSATGSGIDEEAISSEIIDKLTQPDAPTDLQAGGRYVTLEPQISDGDALDAITAAERMSIDFTLAWGGAPQAQSATPSGSPAPSESATPSPSPTPSQSPTPIKIFTVDAQTVHSWIIFGTRPDGSYGPTTDPALVQAYLWTLSPQVGTTPVEPSITFDSSGKPAGLAGGKDGIGIDVGATSRAIQAYLDGLVTGGHPGSAIAIVVGTKHPQTTLASLSDLVKIGSWTTIFYPDVSNGNGVNIRLPASILNGRTVGPGKQFDFLESVGPIDWAHGWRMGGVIQGGKSDHTGAIGGGICSVSTTMFNAAARAGLQIDERHAHYYYIDRYPVGLDATVYSNGNQVWDLKWTNDTPNPIVIHGSSTYGSKSSITFELWSLPLDRTVTFSPEFRANVVRAGDRTVYVTSLAPGQQNRAEYPTAGFDTSRTRTVTDSTGKVIHTDTWDSHYTMVNGLLQIGVAPAPPPAPTPPPAGPTPTPAPATVPTPAPSLAPAGRRRDAR